MATTTDRTIAWSTQLATAHDTLRRRLRHLRTNLGTANGGDLLSHCLAFCSALTSHHVGEDDGMFVELLRAHPDLAPVVANLVQDHHAIAGIVTAARDLATEAVGATSERRVAIGRELDGLAAIMESHFGYEERAVGAGLDAAVADTGWTTPVLQFDEHEEVS